MSRILLVDDEIFVLEMLKQMVTSYLACEIVTAKSVDEALERLAEQSVDVIVLDINMHGSSSLYFTEALQEKPEWKTIPVVVLSAMSFDQMKEAFKSRGVKAYFSKEDIVLPEGREEFLATLRAVINGH